MSKQQQNYSTIPPENKMHLKKGFGESFLCCKCPNPTCNFLINWKYTDDGVWRGHCCGQAYEMIAETVSFVRLGETTEPQEHITRRRLIATRYNRPEESERSEKLLEEAADHALSI